jgi:Tfx family DNA-binding protein
MMEKRTVDETTLTKRQMEVLKLRNEGLSQEEIAKRFGQTKQNISAIERMAWANVKKAENTIKFVKLLEAPIWFSVEENIDLDEIVGRIFSEADKAKIHMTYDSLSLAMKIREEARDKIKHRVILRRFEIGVTREGGIILI